MMKKLLAGRYLVAPTVLLFVAGCGQSTAPVATPVADGDAVPAVTIMTFNALNLFDNVDDPGKDDKAYLPIAAKQNPAHIAQCNEIEVESWRDECLYLDWSDAVLDQKLKTLAATIMQVNDGRGPDVIAFQEIENAAVLDRLSVDYLPESNYGPAILIEGNDSRGIDVAFLSRLPLAEPPVLHPVRMDAFAEREGDTRGILQATFQLPDGSYLTGFSVHFPAPYHPTEMREIAYRRLNELRAALPKDHNSFAAGDFNTTSSEDAAKHLLERFVRPHWTVAHEYCRGCPGTYYYRPDDSWSFLDMILFSPARSEKTTWRIRADSVRLANRLPGQIDAFGAPRRFDPASGLGVSDHLPVVAEIEATSNQ